MFLLTSKTVPLTATQIGFDGSVPLWSDNSCVVIGSFLGGFGVGGGALEGADMFILDIWRVYGVNLAWGCCVGLDCWQRK